MNITLANCQICRAQMSNSALDGHILMHNSETKPFKCSTCVECYFETLQELQDHYYFMHKYEANRPVLTILKEEIHVLETTKMPILTNKATPAYPTSTCTVCFRTMDRRQISRHMRMHNSVGRPFQCTLGCVKLFFISSHNLANHKYYHHDRVEKDKKHSLNEENYVFTEIQQESITPRSDLLPEWVSATVDAEITSAQTSHVVNCPVCDRQVKYLNRHMQIHNPANRSFQCVSGCVRTYCTTQAALELHMYKIHRKCSLPVSTVSTVMKASSSEIHKKWIQCTICSKDIRCRGYGLHLRTHNPTGRPFQCNKGCIRVFAPTQMALKFHNRVYHPTAPVKKPLRSSVEPPIKSLSKTKSTCPVCGIRLCGSGAHMHMATHNRKGRPFKCTEGCIQIFFKSLCQRTAHYTTKHGKVVAKLSAEKNHSDEPTGNENTDNMQVLKTVPIEPALSDSMEKSDTKRGLQCNSDKLENKRRRQSIANMILELPSGSSEENRLKLIDLYSVCK